MHRKIRRTSVVTGLAVAVAAVVGGVPFGTGVAHAASVYPSSAPIVGVSATPDGKGYWEVAADGGIFAFGDAQFYGSMGGQHLNAGMVGVAATPDGKGYWEVAADGGIFAFGDAQFYGSMGGQHLNAGMVGVAATPDGKGYWEVAADGGIFAFGDAQFYGSMGGQHLNAGMVGVAATPDGKGYWEVAADGGIFAFGDAQFYGSMGGQHLNAGMVGVAATPDGKGYWEVAADGGIFAFGDAQFYGSMGGQHLNAGMVGVAATPDGKGYWEVAYDGGIFAYGTSHYYGSVQYTSPGPGASLGDHIAAIADAEHQNSAHNHEIGGSNCNYYSYSLGGGSLCSNGWRAEEWCADFARWVWGQAGANTAGLTAGAISFEWSRGGWHSGNLSGIQAGDVIGWNFGGSTSDDHVSLVVGINPDGSVDTLDGNWNNAITARTIPASGKVSGYTLSGYAIPAS